MESTSSVKQAPISLKTLPGDDIRQILWRFSDRFDLQMLIQSARGVARGPVARAVASGLRNTHEWTKEKADLLKEFDAAGISSASIDPEYGGYIEGPKNLALSLLAYEMAWVDAGAATCSMANTLALAPIHERGTAEQKKTYMSRSIPPQPGEDRKIWRGAFALTEPIPYVGVDTGVVGGKVRVAEWKTGKEPMLQVDKRGRFITNMGFANFVTATVDSDDKRIKGSCVIILEEGDPGLFDRGTPTRKLAHQLSSTRDPIFSLKVPANRIVGGYTIKEGVIIPNYNHSEILEAVFAHTRVTPGVMTSAKLISSVEPIIRYHRKRFRGGSSAQEGTPRHDLGLQQKEDVLQRLVDVWSTGEAGASLGFTAARLLDLFDPLEKEKDRVFAAQGIQGGRAQFKAFRSLEKSAVEYLSLSSKKVKSRQETERIRELESNVLVKFMLLDSVLGVMIPACKLWNTGHGVNTMREAVSLMGGYGITEDCPGFLGYKWIDGQLEATYEGPEVVQRRQLSMTMTQEVFLVQFRHWILEMRQIASKYPDSGACALASSMQLWLWTLEHLLKAKDSKGRDLYQSHRHGVTFPLADALSWIVASRCQILDLVELIKKGPENPALAEGLAGFVNFFSDLSHVHAARSAGEVGRTCAELVFGYNRHPRWDDENCEGCFKASDLDSFESVMPGIEAVVRSVDDVLESDGSHPEKAGPCVRFKGYEEFVRLRSKLDGCLTGSRIAKDRAAASVSQVMIPEALDYPA